MEKMDCRITNVKKSDRTGEYVIYYTYIDTVDGDEYDSRECYNTQTAKQAKDLFNSEFPR